MIEFLRWNYRYSRNDLFERDSDWSSPYLYTVPVKPGNWDWSDGIEPEKGDGRHLLDKNSLQVVAVAVPSDDTDEKAIEDLKLLNQRWLQRWIQGERSFLEFFSHIIEKLRQKYSFPFLAIQGKIKLCTFPASRSWQKLTHHKEGIYKDVDKQRWVGITQEVRIPEWELDWYDEEVVQ